MREFDDIALLRQYVENGSEAAFATLVERHVSLVYSVAARSANNSQAAEEITQAVFIILARKAKSLKGRTVLAGWLYQTARLTAANFLRGEIRRQRREQEASMQSVLEESATDDTWRQIAPLLEDAMGGLGKSDRNALVLRFFEAKSLAEVGIALGTTEDAAKMRVNRALEKLRKFFGKRGISSATAIIAGAISANSVHAATPGLAQAISAVALTKGAVASASTLNLVQGALKLMAWTKAKTAIMAGAGILLAAGTTTIVTKQMVTPVTPFIRIEGTSRIELYSYLGQSRVVETGNLVILTDGKSYRISLASQGHSRLTNDVYAVNADYGCDGVDTFVLSDQLSVLHRTHEGFGGFAYPGRFPSGEEFAPSVVQATWLAYCSRDYFNLSSNQTGLMLGNTFSIVWPGYVTNLVTYWPGSTLPQSITGWSRNWVLLSRTNSLQPMQAAELKQYPHGFKAWKFTASDPVQVGNLRVPRQITLETFFPKPPDTATTGDETQLLRRATFVADSIEAGKGRLNPFPPVSVPDLEVMDSRFADVAGNFVIISHATPKGWPVRGSKGFQQAAAQAEQIVSENPDAVQSQLEDNERVPTPP